MESSPSVTTGASHAHVHVLGWGGLAWLGGFPFSDVVWPNSSSKTAEDNRCTSRSTPPLHRVGGSSTASQKDNHNAINDQKSQNGGAPSSRAPVQAHEYLFTHLLYRCPLLEAGHIAMSSSSVQAMPQQDEGEARGTSTPPPTSSRILKSTSASHRRDVVLHLAHPSQIGEEEAIERGEEEAGTSEGEDVTPFRALLNGMRWDGIDAVHRGTACERGVKGQDYGMDGEAKSIGGKDSGNLWCTPVVRNSLEKIVSPERLKNIQIFYPFSQASFAIMEKQLREVHAKEQARRARTLYSKLVPLSVFAASTSSARTFIEENEQLYFDIIIATDRPSFEYIVQYYSHQKPKMIRTGKEIRGTCSTTHKCHIHYDHDDDEPHEPQRCLSTSSSSPLPLSASTSVRRKRWRDGAVSGRGDGQEGMEAPLEWAGVERIPLFPSFFCRKPILIVYPSTSDSRLLDSNSSSGSRPTGSMMTSGGGGVDTSRTFPISGTGRSDPHPTFPHSIGGPYVPPPLNEKAMEQCCHGVQQLLEMLLVKSHIRENERGCPSSSEDRVNEKEGSKGKANDMAEAEEGDSRVGMWSIVEGDEGSHMFDEKTEGTKKIIINREKEFYFNTNWRDDIEGVLAFLSPILSVDFMVALV